MAKRQVKNKVSSKKYSKYKIEGKTIKRDITCPKCGPGMFLANHKDRQTCGSCGYTQFKGKEQPKPAEAEQPKEAPKPEEKKEAPKPEEKQ